MISIEKHRQDVDAKHPADNTNANTNNSGAVVESTDAKSSGAFNYGSDDGTIILAKKLKERISFRGLLEADGHQLKQSGRYAMCRCPFHSDRTPSFAVNVDKDNYARCFGCRWHGDIFSYEMDYFRVDFKAAWARLIDFYYKCPRKGRKAKPKVTPKDVPAELSEAQQSERKKYAERLATDRWIATEICRQRFERNGEKWSPETIQKLAVEGSLGWAGDALTFIYPTGTKYRNWPAREFIWECNGTSLWRQHRVADASHIYLTESETDAISLIDAGFEHDAGNAVIAAPSATSFKPEWASLFKAKAVTFCFDNDRAGETGLEMIAPMVEPYAAKLSTFDLEEAV